jgi:hypothetical protein
MFVDTIREESSEGEMKVSPKHTPPRVQSPQWRQQQRTDSNCTPTNEMVAHTHLTDSEKTTTSASEYVTATTSFTSPTVIVDGGGGDDWRVVANDSQLTPTQHSTHENESSKVLHGEIVVQSIGGPSVRTTGVGYQFVCTGVFMGQPLIAGCVAPVLGFSVAPVHSVDTLQDHLRTISVTNETGITPTNTQLMNGLIQKSLIDAAEDRRALQVRTHAIQRRQIKTSVCDIQLPIYGPVSHAVAPNFNRHNRPPLSFLSPSLLPNTSRTRIWSYIKITKENLKMHQMILAQYLANVTRGSHLQGDSTDPCGSCMFSSFIVCSHLCCPICMRMPVERLSAVTRVPFQ